MRVLSVFASDADNLPGLMHALAHQYRPESTDSTFVPDDVWSLGYYAQGRALIIRKPAELVDSRHFFQLADKLRSRVLLGAVNELQSSTEHAPPYRFRSWLFTTHGETSSLEAIRDRVVERLPDFICSELRLESGAELGLAMFLRELHERSILDNPLVTPRLLAEALNNTARSVESLLAEANLVPQFAMLATNGSCNLVHSFTESLTWRLQEGLDRGPDGVPDSSLTNFNQVVEGLKRFRAIVITDLEGSLHPARKVIRVGETAYIDKALNLSYL